MKKSTLLSLATAGAIVVTSAGTFATWDQLTANASQTVSINEQYRLGTLTFETFSTATDTTNASELVYDASFKVAADASKFTALQLAPVVSGTDITLDTDYSIQILESDTPLTSNNDTTLDVGGTNTYTVRLIAKTDKMAGQTINVKVDVTGTPKTN